MLFSPQAAHEAMLQQQKEALVSGRTECSMQPEKTLAMKPRNNRRDMKCDRIQVEESLSTSLLHTKGTQTL